MVGCSIRVMFVKLISIEVISCGLMCVLLSMIDLLIRNSVI